MHTGWLALAYLGRNDAGMTHSILRFAILRFRFASLRCGI
jgi:hypothetical protein